MQPLLNSNNESRIAMFYGRATLALFAVAFALWCCSSRRSALPNSGPTEPLRDFTGVWTGTSTSSVHAAKVKITLEITRIGNDLTGLYRCAPFLASCRNGIQLGRVIGVISARTFRVALVDMSSCIFRLGDFYISAGGGEYTCYMGGNLIDHGKFEVQRRESNASTTDRPF